MSEDVGSSRAICQSTARDHERMARSHVFKEKTFNIERVRSGVSPL